MDFFNLNVFILFCFFFNDTATTEIYTLSLHDALPISSGSSCSRPCSAGSSRSTSRSSSSTSGSSGRARSEEHTSELQSRLHLVCRLLLEKKKYTYSYKQINLSNSSLVFDVFKIVYSYI